MGIFFSARVIKQYRDKKRLIQSTVLWIAFWIAISILAFDPHNKSVFLANKLGFKSNINAVIFISLGFLFLFNMYFTAIVEKMEKQLTEIVRKLAIENQELREKVADYEIKLLKNKEGDNKAEKVAE